MQNLLHQHFLLSVHLFGLQKKSLNGLKAETGCFYTQLSGDKKSLVVFLSPQMVTVHAWSQNRKKYKCIFPSTNKSDILPGPSHSVRVPLCSASSLVKQRAGGGSPH